ncbi:hypothetical protein PFISCL1PPCAC_19380, partial [Pristionchus fissidentatus]
SYRLVSSMIPLLLFLTLIPLLLTCFKPASVRTQAKKKYKPGHIPVFEDPEKPENSTQYDMKTERFFPKKGEENPFEEDCREKTEKTPPRRSHKDNRMQMQPSSGEDKPAAPAAAAGSAPTVSPAVQPTQPSVPSPTQ